jgi:hypothetical protein
MTTFIKSITPIEVKELISDVEKNKPKIRIDIEGNINRITIITIKKRKIVGYIHSFNEIIKED